MSELLFILKGTNGKQYVWTLLVMYVTVLYLDCNEVYVFCYCIILPSVHFVSNHCDICVHTQGM